MSQSKTLSESELLSKQNASDALLYWMNSTTAVFGANTTINFLLYAVKDMLEAYSHPEDADRIEEVVTNSLVQTFDAIREGARTKTEDESVFAGVDKKVKH